MSLIWFLFGTDAAVDPYSHFSGAIDKNKMVIKIQIRTSASNIYLP